MFGSEGKRSVERNRGSELRGGGGKGMKRKYVQNVSFFLFLFLFWPPRRHMKLLGQGSDPSHS